MFPAAVRMPAPASEVADRFAEILEAIPEALTDRRPARVLSAKAKALALWEREHAKLLMTLPEADRAAFESAMAMLRPRSGEAAGLAALEAMALLEHRLPDGRPRWLATADRAGMRAWILLGQRSSSLPDLEAAFQPLVAHDGGRHPQAVTRTRAELARFRKAIANGTPQEAQKAVGVLLDLVDAFEK
jgi:hypothetical protein